jgi:hypothetical protein
MFRNGTGGGALHEKHVHVACMGEMQYACTILVRKRVGNRHGNELLGFVTQCYQLGVHKLCLRGPRVV